MLRTTIVAAAILLGVPSLAWSHGPKPAPPTSHAVPSAESAEAARVVDAFHAALGRGDTSAALRLLAEDALIFESGGVERSRAEYAAHHLAADAAFAQAVPSTRTRRVSRSDGPFAWVASEGRTTGVWKGKPVDRRTTETVLLRREGGRWLIVHIHWSSGAAPAP
jgi:ketosteroid isomerase-like protein